MKYVNDLEISSSRNSTLVDERKVKKEIESLDLDYFEHETASNMKNIFTYLYSPRGYGNECNLVVYPRNYVES